MRSTTVLPETIQCFPEYLRKIGYYCTNSSKTDYNFAVPKTAWDETSRKAHWRNRKPDQPFFSVFNYMLTHESRIRHAPRSFQEATARLAQMKTAGKGVKGHVAGYVGRMAAYVPPKLKP